ncbi:MAG: hypothetical protein LBU90_03725 [Bacteroidales bacterium]|jgi:hypothetical protein|nr:hypothetical protein [Bacteroidales bacterium]
MATTKSIRKKEFLAVLKEIGEANNLKFGPYSEKQLFAKLAALQSKKTLKKVRKFTWLTQVCADWWVSETF